MYTMTSPKIEYVKTEDAIRVSPNARREREYNELLKTVTNRIAKIVKKVNASGSKSKSVLETVKELQDYSKNLKDWATGKVNAVIYNLNEDSRKKWLKHSEKISKKLWEEIGGEPIKALMNQYIEQNAELISSLPLVAAKKVEKIVLENLKTGEERAESLTDIIMEIGKLPDTMESRAKLIARTEVSKMSTGLTKARAEEVGMGWYVWRSTHDMRVRSSHSLMDGVLINWSDPASPEQLDRQKRSYGNYHAGEIFNCRCYPEPLVRVDDVSWPAKVYHNGMIVRMRKSDFIRISEGQIPL